MADKVVDASALAAVVFEEPASQQIVQRLAGATLFAPPILVFELANIAWKKSLKYPDQAERINLALEAFLLLPVRQIATDFLRILDLAISTGVTTYDAAYLVAAQEMSVELVTLDKKLEAIALRLAPPA